MNTEKISTSTVFDSSLNQNRKSVSTFNLVERPGEKVGLEETKNVVGFGIALANSIVLSLRDGKITLADIPYFISSLTKLPAALAGIGSVPIELSNIQKPELQELIKFVKDEVDTDDTIAEAIIEQSLLIIYDVYDLISSLKQK